MNDIKNRSDGLSRQIDLRERASNLLTHSLANLVIARTLRVSVATFVALTLSIVCSGCGKTLEKPISGGGLPQTDSPGRDAQESGTKIGQSPVGGVALEGAFQAAIKGKKLAPATEPLSIISIAGTQNLLTFYRSGEVAYFRNAETAGRVILNFGDSITSGAFHVGEGLIALASNQSLRIYSLPNLEPRYTWDLLKTRISSMDFAPDGRSLLLGGADGMVYRWRFGDYAAATTVEERENLFEKYFGHASIVSQVRFHPFGRVFFSADWSGVVLAWLRYDSDQYGGAYDHNLLNSPLFIAGADRMKLGRVDTDQIEALGITVDGKLLLVATQAGLLELWKTRGLKKETGVVGHRGLIYDAAISQNGSRIISSGRDGKLKGWKLVKTPDPGNVMTVWTLEEDGLAEGLDIRRIACRADGSCVGANSQGKVLSLPISLKE